MCKCIRIYELHIRINIFELRICIATYTYLRIQFTYRYGVASIAALLLCRSFFPRITHTYGIMCTYTMYVLRIRIYELRIHTHIYELRIRIGNYTYLNIQITFKYGAESIAALLLCRFFFPSNYTYILNYEYISVFTNYVYVFTYTKYVYVLERTRN